MNRDALAYLVVCLLVCAGCGREGETALRMAPVVGTVSVDGTPANSGSVLFYPMDSPEEAPVSSGTIQADGSYELAGGAAGKGAWIGRHTIVVLPQNPGPVAVQETLVPIPEKYSIPDTSGIVKVVTDGDNRIDIDLTFD